MQRGYARGRAKDEEVRRSLKPLRPGERPARGDGRGGGGRTARAGQRDRDDRGLERRGGIGQRPGAWSAACSWRRCLLLVAYGMWKARYWAVLGMQTLLAITLVISSLALIQATSIFAALILVA